MNSILPFNYTATTFDVEFDNCSRAQIVWEYFRNQNQDDAIASNNTQTEVYQYIIESLEYYLRGVWQQPPPMSDQFWSWARSYAYKGAGWYMKASCSAEMCRVLGWTGNPDLAGVGVMMEPCVQIVTLYLTDSYRCWPHMLYRRSLSRSISSRSWSSAANANRIKYLGRGWCPEPYSQSNTQQ
jgi:hypothetical protein